MSWFRREPPPPPPSKIPAWVQLATPIIMAIVLGLFAFIGNSFSESIKEVKEQVKTVDQEKVDNKTLQLMIQRQDILIQHQQEESERQRDLDSKKFEDIQKTQTKTLERIETMQGEKRSVMISPPSNVSIGGKADVLNKACLTPQEFEKYLSMDPNTRIKYKQYLQSRGKDISGLPD